MSRASNAVSRTVPSRTASRLTSWCWPTTRAAGKPPIWLLGQDSHRFADDRQGPSPDELTGRLLRDPGTRVTSVEVDELGPEVTVARIELATPAGPEHVTARLNDGLAMAITAGAPIRVAAVVMDRLSVPAATTQDGPMPKQTARDLSADLRPRYEPRNLTFAVGLDYWVLGGSFTENTLQSHWEDYRTTADHGSAVLSAAVSQPEGFAWLAQEIFADDYRGTTVTFRGQCRTPGTTGRTGLVLTGHEATHRPRALHRAGRTDRPEQSHRHDRERRRLGHARGHRANPRRRGHRCVRRLPGRPRPDRPARPGADPGGWLSVAQSLQPRVQPEAWPSWSAGRFSGDRRAVAALSGLRIGREHLPGPERVQFVSFPNADLVLGEVQRDFAVVRAAVSQPQLAVRRVSTGPRTVECGEEAEDGAVGSDPHGLPDHRLVMVGPGVSKESSKKTAKRCRPRNECIDSGQSQSDAN